MDVLIFLLPLGLFILVMSFAFFFWTVKNKQYEDLDGASQRILTDTDE
jgi:cbb3-type cytochrome oxidase maturation protein